MTFSGALVQNAIYIAQQPPEWPITAGDWERAAEERLDPGAFGYIAGGAGTESTMRANLDAFAKWRIRPRMLSGNVVRDISVDVLGLHSPGPFLLAPVGVLSIAHEAAEVAVGEASASSGVPMVLSSAATNSIEEVAATSAPRWFQLYWVNDREICASFVRRAEDGRVRRDRGHARHADARLAATGSAPGVSAVHQGRGLWAVLLRPGVPVAARKVAAGGPAHRRRHDARDLPEPRPDLG